MKKVIVVVAMATVVVIAGITGSSSAAHAAVFFTPAGTAVMSSWLLSPPVPLIFSILSYTRVQ
jgi:hypothetical protein